MSAKKPTVRIAATADIHYSKTATGSLQGLFAAASEEADVLLLCGDLTDYGHAEEAKVLADDLRKHVKIPVLAVLGNHDYETGHAVEINQILSDAGVTMLDGECVEVKGIGFAGVCGFGGGFGRAMLNGWGEPAIKHFVQEAIDQAMRLERALARLETEKRVVLLHYAPIRETVEGENPEIMPFLGSSRLEGPLNRFNVTAAFHGHAHGGAPEGLTSTQVPVYNVAMQVLKKAQPEGKGYRILEVAV
jgi:Icc-related predicted phosphoesterase